jgi:hypothetical protein
LNSEREGVRSTSSKPWLPHLTQVDVAISHAYAPRRSDAIGERVGYLPVYSAFAELQAAARGKLAARSRP